jgi:hypothetical protein
MSINYGSDKIKDVQFGMGKTNCLTYIPQDIKLTLSDGILTLKAGSKVYVPNGSGVFDTITIANDISNTGYASKALAITDGNSLLWTSNVFSGTSAPATPSNGYIWYDTTNNSVKRYSSSSGSWVSGFSFPVALLNPNVSGTVIEVQVFNGFGYIGSTAFALPGVKGLCSDGLNPDGTYKNVEVTIPKVLIREDTGSGERVDAYNPSSVGIGSTDYSSYIKSPNKPTITYGYWLDTANNIFYNVNNGVFSQVLRLPLSKFSQAGDKVTSLTPYPVQTDNTSVPIRVIYNGSDLVYDKVISYTTSADFVGTKIGLDVWGTNEYHQINGRYDSGNYTDTMEFSEEQIRGNWKLSFYYFKQNNWTFSNFIISVTYEDDTTEEVYNSVELVNVNSVGTTKTISITMSKPWKTISIYASGGRSHNENSYGGTGKVKMIWKGTEQ